MESVGTLHTLYNTDNPNEGEFEKDIKKPNQEPFPIKQGWYVLMPLTKTFN